MTLLKTDHRLDEHLALAETQTRNKTDLYFSHVQIHLVSPVDLVAGLLATLGNTESFIACHLKLYYHSVPFLLNLFYRNNIIIVNR